MNSEPEALRRAADLIVRAGRAAALTGAGISVESGIPDFRSRGGLWTRYPPEEYATIHAYRKNPAKVWKMLAEMEDLLKSAEPNPAHETLSRMEADGLLKGVVTQNIDGLHHLAGSKNVIEFHGSHRSLTCLDCGAAFKGAEAEKMDRPPRCPCGGVPKPDVVFFGEEIPVAALNGARALASGVGAMLVVGTSAEVAPASHMPAMAKRNGAVVIEINLEPTGLTGSVTDVFIKGKAGAVLPRLYGEIARIS